MLEELISFGLALSTTLIGLYTVHKTGMYDEIKNEFRRQKRKTEQEQLEQKKVVEEQQKLDQERIEEQNSKQEEKRSELKEIKSEENIARPREEKSVEEKHSDTEELNEKDIESVLLKIEGYTPEEIKAYLSKIQSSLVKNTIAKISKDQDPSFIIGKLLALNINEIERKICQLLIDDHDLLIKFVNSDYCNNTHLNLIKEIVPSLFTGNHWQAFKLETLFKLSNCSSEMIAKGVLANMPIERVKEILADPACNSIYILSKKELFCRIVADRIHEKVFDNNLLKKLLITDDDDLTNNILSNHVFCCILAESKYLLNEKQRSILFTALMTAKNFLRGTSLKHEGLIEYVRTALEYGIQHFDKYSHLWRSFLKGDHSKPFHEFIRDSLLHSDLEAFIKLDDPVIFLIIFPNNLPNKGIYKTLSSETLLALAEKSTGFSNYILQHSDLLKIVCGNMGSNIETKLKRLLSNPSTKAIAGVILARPDTDLDVYDVLSKQQAEELFHMNVDFARRIFSRSELREKFDISYETFFMFVADPKRENFCVELFSRVPGDFTGFVQNAYSLAPEFLKSRIQFYSGGKIVFEQKTNSLPFPYHAKIANNEVPKEVIENINEHKKNIESHFKLLEGSKDYDEAISRCKNRLNSLGAFSFDEKRKIEKRIAQLENVKEQEPIKEAIPGFCNGLTHIAESSPKKLNLELIPLEFLQIDPIFNTLIRLAQRNPWAAYFYIDSIELTNIKEGIISEKINLITQRLAVSLLADASNKKIIASLLRTPQLSQYWSRETVMQIVVKYPDFAKFCFVYPHLCKKLTVEDFLALGKIAGYGETKEEFIKYLQESNIIIENLLKNRKDLQSTGSSSSSSSPSSTTTPTLLKKLNSQVTSPKNMNEQSVDKPPTNDVSTPPPPDNVSPPPPPSPPQGPAGSEPPKNKASKPPVSKPARLINLTNLLGDEAVKKFEKALKINNFTREQVETKTRYNYLVQWVGDIFENAEFKKAQSEKTNSAEVKPLIENLYSTLVSDLTKEGRANMLNEVIKDDFIASIVSGYEFSIAKNAEKNFSDAKSKMFAQIRKPRQLKSQSIPGLKEELANEIFKQVPPEKKIDAKKVLRDLFSTEDLDIQDKKKEELRAILLPNSADQIMQKIEMAIKDNEQANESLGIKNFK